MNHVRIHGDPFGCDPAASLLRSFLRLALGSGMQCSLSLAAVEPGPVGVDERSVALTDGVRDFTVGTRLPPAEIDLLLRAANVDVAATAPVVVFAAVDRRDDAVREAGLLWSRACHVLAVRDGAGAPELLERVRAELRWAGTEHPPHALDEREAANWASLPTVVAGGPVVWVGDDAFAGGLDLVLAAVRSLRGQHDVRLRLVVTAVDPAVRNTIEVAVAAERDFVEVVGGGFEPAHVRDASAVVLPWRRCGSTRTLALALASGRPVVAARFAATAALLDRPGTCHPVGGRWIQDEPGQAAHFVPHPAALAHALAAALVSAPAAVATGRRARTFVTEELVRGRPSAPPAAVGTSRTRRPSVVLEAALFETSSTAELTIATARALLERDRVDVRLVPVPPFRQRLAVLRERAPELLPLLVRDPGDVDLWLSSGWPVRSARPACRTWALRVDQEYGTLPVELTPHVTQDADVVVAHSEHVYRTLTAAGRPMPGIQVIPHGVDAAMHEDAPPDADIVAWKGDRPAVLFCGGMVWRKGFDVFLQGLLAAWQRQPGFCVVVKSVGQDQHYGRFHLGELLAKFRATKGTPPLRIVDGDLSRTQLASLYTACDVLVHPYRGEGFCLPVAEARACGLPVLATAGGATEALMVGPGAVKIPSARRSLELPTPHVALPWVFEPNAKDTGDLLAATLRDLPQVRAQARAFARNVRSAFPWSAAAATLEDLAFAAVGKRRFAPPIGEPLVTLPQVEARRATTPVPTPVGG